MIKLTPVCHSTVLTCYFYRYTGSLFSRGNFSMVVLDTGYFPHIHTYVNKLLYDEYHTYICIRIFMYMKLRRYLYTFKYIYMYRIHINIYIYTYVPKEGIVNKVPNRREPSKISTPRTIGSFLLNIGNDKYE
jgi:hypothetical protein